jgi:Imidazolonepropionase and related amidohydrolases
MKTIVLKNVRVLDTESCEVTHYDNVVLNGGRIAELNHAPVQEDGREVIDCKGLTLMPGLIDCHVHINMSSWSTVQNATLPNSLVAARAARILNGMLMRGFTTVRDVGGADRGYVMAIEEGTIVGPDLVICGKMLCQTGGHQDVRAKWDEQDPEYLRFQLGSKSHICDGVPEVRKAVRQEIRAGAQFIKIIANGGLAPTGVPITHLAFSEEEIAAIVEEAIIADTYVAAHAYTDKAIERCVRLGVRTIEHCVFVSEKTARMMKEKGCFAVPTMATFETLEDKSSSMTPEQQARAQQARESAYNAMVILKEAGVPMAFGTDLTHISLHYHQSDEFTYRSRVLPAKDVLQSATINAARLLRKEHEIGNVFAGAKANLLLVEGNPAEDATLLSKPVNMRLIIKNGEVIKNTVA